MFDVGGGELILIVLAILLLFGPKKIPEIAQMVGKGMQHVRKAQAQLQVQMNEIQNEIKAVVEEPKDSVSISSPVRNYESSVPPDKTSEEIEELYRSKNGEIQPEEIPTVITEIQDIKPDKTPESDKK